MHRIGASGNPVCAFVLLGCASLVPEPTEAAQMPLINLAAASATSALSSAVTSLRPW